MSRLPPLSKLEMGCNHPRGFECDEQGQLSCSNLNMTDTYSNTGNSKMNSRHNRRQSRLASVQPVVETGMTVQLAQYMKEFTVKTRRQPGELFKRIKASIVAEYLRAARTPEQLDDGGFAQPMDEYQISLAEKQASATWIDYLLLDCRDFEEYNRCHIKTALHYPRTKLNHATNPFLSEMVMYKNKPNKMIVLYDLEEECVVEFGNALYQRGFDNVGIIAGGLREFVQEFSDEVSGVCTIPIMPKDERMQRRMNAATSSLAARSETIKTVHKPKSLSSSLAKPHVRAFIPSSYYASDIQRREATLSRN